MAYQRVGFKLNDRLSNLWLHFQVKREPQRELLMCFFVKCFAHFFTIAVYVSLEKKKNILRQILKQSFYFLIVLLDRPFARSKSDRAFINTTLCWHYVKFIAFFFVRQEHDLFGPTNKIRIGTHVKTYLFIGLIWYHYFMVGSFERINVFKNFKLKKLIIKTYI